MAFLHLQNLLARLDVVLRNLSRLVTGKDVVGKRGEDGNGGF